MEQRMHNRAMQVAPWCPCAGCFYGGEASGARTAGEGPDQREAGMSQQHGGKGRTLVFLIGGVLGILPRTAMWKNKSKLLPSFNNDFGEPQ